MTLYQEIRAAGRKLHDKALQSTKHLEFDPVRIAKRMTLPVAGRTLVFQDEVVQYGFFDFWFHEYRVNGKTLLEHVDPAGAGLEPLEVEVLEAHRRARTSFFSTELVSAGEHRVCLRDQLDPNGRELWLTDMGLSASMDRIGIRLALFCREVVVRGITMTSGFSFGFEMEGVPGILEAHRQKMKKVARDELSEARFVFFFRKYLAEGVEQEYRDVI